MSRIRMNRGLSSGDTSAEMPRQTYDLETRVRTVQTGAEFQLDQAMSFGDMPPSMLMMKFEETDMGNEEFLYNDYARNTLTNWGPDTNLFEHEAPRVDGGHRAGFLNARYGSHRGAADIDPYRPEHFDADIGPETRDPRGINTEPDMYKLKGQHEARMRFVTWSKDHDDSVTGGGRSESQLMADQQKMYRRGRQIFKVFERQLDGRRNGMARVFSANSKVKNQVLMQSYGDRLRADGLTPQRRASIIIGEIGKNIRFLRSTETTDADFSVAVYGQAGRTRKHTRGDISVLTMHQTDGYLPDSDKAIVAKTAGILMSDIVKCKHAVKNDAEFGDQAGQIHSKGLAPAQDLAVVLRSVQQGGDFAESAGVHFKKTADRKMAAHGIRVVRNDHDLPAHMLLNAEIIRKTVVEGGDLSKIRGKTIRDAAPQVLSEEQAKAAKSAAMRIASGAKVGAITSGDFGDSSARVVNYRMRVIEARSRVNGHVVVPLSDGDDTQNRRPAHNNYRATTAEDIKIETEFGVNASAERHGRAIGSKYTQRLIDGEQSGESIGAMA